MPAVMVRRLERACAMSSAIRAARRLASSESAWVETNRSLRCLMRERRAVSSSASAVPIMADHITRNCCQSLVSRRTFTWFR